MCQCQGCTNFSQTCEARTHLEKEEMKQIQKSDTSSPCSNNSERCDTEMGNWKTRKAGTGTGTETGTENWERS